MRAGIGLLRRHRVALLRFALAHHPTCSRFREDMLPLRAGRRPAGASAPAKVPVCVGCLAFWPAVLGGFPLALLAAAQAGLRWPALALACVGLAVPQLASYAGLARTRGRKAATKASFGLGVACGAAAVVRLPLEPLAQAGTLLMLAAGAGALQALRLRKLLRACDACPWRRDWDRCPGFHPVNRHERGAMPPAPPGNAPMGPVPTAWPWPDARQEPASEAPGGTFTT